MLTLHRKLIGGASLVAAALIAVSCSDRTITTPSASTLTPSAVHTSVAAFNAFGWLAPLGGAAANASAFDPTGATSVSICAWSGTACTAAPVMQFSTTPSAGQGTLTANTTAGDFEASWNLLSNSFAIRKTYRISVLNGSTEIGAILVDVVRGRWALTRTDGTLATLAAANELPIRFTVTLPPVKINEVESSGGVPGDWVELFNAGTTTVDLSGFVFKDNDDTHHYAIPAGTSIAPGGYVVLDEANFGFGLGAPDAARLFTPGGTLVDGYSWTTHAATTYGRCPDGTGSFTTMTSVTKGATNDCSVPNTVRINEVESSGGTPGDWIELYNSGAIPVDLSGYILRDNDDTHTYVIPQGTTIGAGAFLVFDEAQFVFGLGAPDAARLFSPTGALIDSFSWTTHAVVTYGRCPDGTGVFSSTTTSTKGSANACGSSTPTTEAWPGGNTVTVVDDANVFGTNMSGLVYEAGAASPGDVLWGVRNGPSAIFRLIFNGSIWTPDPSNGWAAGKTLTYTNGTGAPDSEDLTFTTGSSAGMYVSTERDNNNNAVSHPAVLRYDVTGTATTLVATNEWDLTADLPVVGANLGLEAITWVPDTYLVAQGFVDPSAGHLYNPADYPNHGSGLFFVGLEGNGVIYVYALNHADNSHHQLTSISTGFPAGVMSLRFDAELGQLWAICDDTCGGLSDIFVIDGTGHLKLTHIFARPSGMGNFNNEGFAFGPQSTCVSGFKPAFWSDDSNDAGHAIRMATIPCVKFP